jgi:hypothetical protein
MVFEIGQAKVLLSGHTSHDRACDLRSLVHLIDILRGSINGSLLMELQPSFTKLEDVFACSGSESVSDSLSRLLSLSSSG